MKYLTRKLIHELISVGAIKIDERILTTQDAVEDASRYDVKVDAATGNPISKVEICPNALDSLKKNIRAWVYQKPEGIDCNLNDKDRASLIHILRKMKLWPAESSPSAAATVAASSINNNSPTSTTISAFPVGRLDKDSCGLLILTNSGGLCERLHHPRFVHEKEYVVEIARKYLKGTSALGESEEFYKRMSSGSVTWKNSKTNEMETALPCVVKPCEDWNNETRRERFTIVLTEGKNRQIRNMVESVGASMIKDGISKLEDGSSMKLNGFYVTFLKRIRVGPIRFDYNENDANTIHSPVFQSRDSQPQIRELQGEELQSLIDFAFFSQIETGEPESETLPQRRSERE